MTSKAVVNVAFGPRRSWYYRGQERLMASLAKHDPSTIVVRWAGLLPDGSPSHHECPFGFKVTALKHAWLQHDYLLWCDSSIYAVAPLDYVWQTVENRRLLVFDSGITVDKWSTDESLKWFGITRDDAKRIPMISACCIGWATRNVTARMAFAEWEHSMPTFAGPRSSHRHDQTALSIIAWKMDIKPMWLDRVMQYAERRKAGIVGDSVCLEAEGM